MGGGSGEVAGDSSGWEGESEAAGRAGAELAREARRSVTLKLVLSLSITTFLMEKFGYLGISTKYFSVLTTLTFETEFRNPWFKPW